MREEAEKNLTLVAERAQLAEGVEGVRSILLIMYRFPSLKNKILSQKKEFPGRKRKRLGKIEFTFNF
ncbi:MAG: hypothetical protein ACXAAH_17765 [Promethearchaeota archaeon]|jgi:hypothetical protein